jgi:hypothetical protein
MQIQACLRQSITSGEALVFEMSDGAERDRRCLLHFTEFANVLNAAKWTGSTITGVIREAWDTDTRRPPLTNPSAPTTLSAASREVARYQPRSSHALTCDRGRTLVAACRSTPLHMSHASTPRTPAGFPKNSTFLTQSHRPENFSLQPGLRPVAHHHANPTSHFHH